MTSSAADELSEALTRLQGERETILGEIATIERDLGEKHESLSDVNEKIEALRKTLAVLRPDLVRDLERPAAPEDEDELSEQTPVESPTAADFSELPRQTAVLGILAGATEAMHYQEIAEIAGAPASSVSPNLSHLKYRDLVETTDPGTYQLAPVLPLESEQEANEALRAVATAIVDDRQWDILEAVFEMDERLPFVGFEHFRRNRLANVTGVRWANDRLTHALMKELLSRELIEVYHTDNPRNPEFPTAAIRLTAEGLDEIEE
ncbi:MAG: helix-turn-helix domain-containing protein [Dehalococcoidia bacterium]|nr:helix-turn-helix domain-containing protein [Dehalococcoidia bacterium]MYD28863.1 helix-turn-helix domain-containing protein [Dehalococcoidia bacterium]